MTPSPNEISYQLAATPSRRRPRKRTPPSQSPGPPLARITRLMALAIQLGGRIAREDLDCGQLARLGHVSRTRVTQILNLLHLAPDIQERLLFLPAVQKGHDPISEKKIRSLASEYDWDRQRRAFERFLLPATGN
jgi:hypothetical protein